MIHNKAEYVVTLTALGLSMIFSYTFFNTRRVKPHKTVNYPIAYVLSAESLEKEYENDYFLADVKYIGKVIEISGKVSARGINQLTLDFFITGVFKKKVVLPGKGKRVKIVGVCAGYDKESRKVILIDCYIKT